MASSRRQSMLIQMSSNLKLLDQLDAEGDADEERLESLGLAVSSATNRVIAPFESKFKPSELRQLALVAHNHMKPAMQHFVETYSEVLQKFRITGTQTTMRMCKALWGEDNPAIEYGLACTSGPLGGDAQIAALMCMEDLGALIFFTDPLSAHPHQADIDSLLRLANCSNVVVCPNPTSAMGMLHMLKGALESGDRGMIPSFFETLESPAVVDYKLAQEQALKRAVENGNSIVHDTHRQDSIVDSVKSNNIFEEDTEFKDSFEEDTVFKDSDEDGAEEPLSRKTTMPRRRSLPHQESITHLTGIRPSRKKKNQKIKMISNKFKPSNKFKMKTIARQIPALRNSLKIVRHSSDLGDTSRSSGLGDTSMDQQGDNQN